MIEILTLSAVIGMAVTLYFIQRRDYLRDRKAWDEERADMLNRLMARDYNEYTRVKDNTPLPKMVSRHDELIKKWRQPENKEPPKL